MSPHLQPLPIHPKPPLPSPRRTTSPFESLPPELALLILHSLPDHDSLTHLISALPTIRSLYALNRRRILASITQNHETVLTRTALDALAARGIPLLEIPYSSLGYLEMWTWGDTIEASAVVSEVMRQVAAGGGVRLSAEQRGRLMDVLAITAWTIDGKGEEVGREKFVQRLRFEQEPGYRERVAKGCRLGRALHFLHVARTKRNFDERAEEWYAAREAERLMSGRESGM